MRKNRLLALVMTLAMLITSTGFVSVANAQEEITIEKVINVAKDFTCTLPDGETVVDTSNIGYQIIKGTDDKYYRVNVGEYKSIMKEDFESYDIETEGTTELSSVQKNGFKIWKKSYEATDRSFAFVKDGTNQVASYGNTYTGWTQNFWLPSKTGIDNFKVSTKVRVASFDLDGDEYNGSTAHGVLKQHLSDGTQMWTLRLYTDTEETKITKTELRVEKTDGYEVADISQYVNYTEPDAEKVVSMTDYITIDVECDLNNWKLSVNGNVIFNNLTYKGEGITTNSGLERIEYAKNESKPNAITYVDDITAYETIYVNDDVSAASCNAGKIPNTASAQQTTTVTLAMDDGSKKDFTVHYTADTSTLGEKTADGRIDGFSETLPVSYKVIGVSNETINTYIGADIKDKIPEADTSKFGRRYYTVSDGESIINYTVNVGEFTQKLKDDMERHTKDTTDSTYETITPQCVDGLNLSLKKASSSWEANSIKVHQESSANQVLKLDKPVYATHATWTIADRFNGDFKLALKLKGDLVDGSSGNGMWFSIYNTDGIETYRAMLDLSKSDKTQYCIQSYRSQSASTASKTYPIVNNSTGWFDVEIIGKSDCTFDVYINKELVAKNHRIMADANGNPVSNKNDIGSVVFTQRYSNGPVSYIDDLTIYNYNCFAGALPETAEVLVGIGESSVSTIDLETSNGGVKTLDINLGNISTTKPGIIQTNGTIDGFDDSINVNAKVCNYHVTAVGYKLGNEFTTAPKNGGTIATAEIVNKGSLTTGTAVFAWYNSNDTLENVKMVSVDGISKNTSKTVDVGLKLPENVSGGYLKVFMIDSLNRLTPVDIATEFAGITAAAPTVYTVGDSTMQSYPIKANGEWPKTGVGQVLGTYFTGATVNNNYAHSGEWTESFIEEGYWKGIKNNLKAGDYVIISLGHNDQGTCERKYSAGDCVYKKNLQLMLDEANAKGANVIIYSPIRRQLEATKEDPFGSHESYGALHNHYKDMVNLCTESKNAGKSVSFIDMTKISGEMLTALGTDAEQQKLYVRDVYNNKTTYTSHSYWTSGYSYLAKTIDSADGAAAQDTSHYNIYGANVYARRIADEIKNLGIILSDYVNDTSAPAYPGF